jgi:uncharacterized protein YcbK (DUF882 family)
MSIDWTNPKSFISVYFNVKEALWLPTWNRMATEKDGLGPIQKDNIIKLMQTMDRIRVLLNKPIVVHVAFRPYSYNKLIGGAPKSAHVQGMACDFSVPGMSCDDVRKMLLPHLDEFNIRMENLPGSSWVHIDTKSVSSSSYRFFKP